MSIIPFHEIILFKIFNNMIELTDFVHEPIWLASEPYLVTMALFAFSFPYVHRWLELYMLLMSWSTLGHLLRKQRPNRVINSTFGLQTDVKPSLSMALALEYCIQLKMIIMNGNGFVLHVNYIQNKMFKIVESGKMFAQRQMKNT